VYAERSLAMIGFFEKHLPREACEWPEPRGGMFLWVRLRCETYPDSTPPKEIAKRVFDTAIAERILTVPGAFFKAPGGRKWSADEEARRIYLRVCYATPTMADLEEGTRRLGRALRTVWRLPLDE
jgi:aromatic amino acid aminotransferase I